MTDRPFKLRMLLQVQMGQELAKEADTPGQGKSLTMFRLCRGVMYHVIS